MLGVDPLKAGDSEGMPFRTITFTNEQVPRTVIHLSSNQYSVENGETNIEKLKQSLTLLGNETARGQGKSIASSGFYISSIWTRQNVTGVATQNAKIFGIAVSHPDPTGTAVRAESTNPTMANS